MALVAGACGGGGGKKTANTTAPEESTTSTSTGETTTTVAETSTSATAATGVTATTQAASTTKTTKKSSASATTIAKPNAQGNLLNVQTTTSTTASGKTPEPGGKLTMAVNADTSGFDPAKGASNGSATEGPRNSAIFDTLFFQDSATYDLVAQLALGITSSDGKVWDLKLRPNVKFTDGTTLNADAVKFNFQRIQDPANASPNRSTANTISDNDRR